MFKNILFNFDYLTNNSLISYNKLSIVKNNNITN